MMEWIEDRLPWLLGGVGVIVAALMVWAIVYDAQNCLRHEQRGYIYIWHQTGNVRWMQMVPNTVCVEWKVKA